MMANTLEFHVVVISILTNILTKGNYQLKARPFKPNIIKNCSFGVNQCNIQSLSPYYVVKLDNSILPYEKA
jgi:hypothetical protein